MNFPFYKQLDAMDCGSIPKHVWDRLCLKMVAEYHGRKYSLQKLRTKSFITRAGISLLGISDAAEAIGYRTMGVKATLDKMAEEAPRLLLPTGNRTTLWMYKIKKLKHTHQVTSRHPMSNYKMYVADPAHGLVTYTSEEFCPLI